MSWSIGPSEPQLAAGEVHVWRVRLTEVEDRLMRTLDEHERKRAAELLQERDRQLWARSRGVLRELLARYLRLQPARIQLHVDEHGKPALATDANEQGLLAFNLSHSGVLALYAFSRAGAVGVDVETATRSLDEAAIAARMLGADEAERLRAISDPVRRHVEFLHAWTRHEAAVKCLGTGIAGAGTHQQTERLWTRALELGADAVAALACEREPHTLRMWSWRA